MSRQNDTKALYREYRAAVRARNDRQAYLILKKITEIAPGDTNAARKCSEIGEKVKRDVLTMLGNAKDPAEKVQILSELKTLFPTSVFNEYKGDEQSTEFVAKSNPGTEVPRRNDDRTKDLYRRLRETMLSRKREDAFNILEEICEVNPNDKAAQQQKQETGDFLCNQHAAEMVRLCRVGNIPELCSLIDSMRRWATTNSLEQIEGFNIAATLVDGFRRQEAEENIARTLTTLRSDVKLSTKERYEKVCEIEGIIAKYGIAMQTDDIAYMNHVKKERSDEKSAIKRAHSLKELSARFTELQNAVDPITAVPKAVLSEHIPLFEELLRQINFPGDYPEVKELARKVSDKLASIRKQLQHRKSVRNLKIFSFLFILSLAVLAAGSCCFVYFSVRSTMKKIEEISGRMKSEFVPEDMQALREITSSPSFILRKSFEFKPDYKVTFDQCKEFIANFDSLCREFSEQTAKMRLLKEHIGLENQTECYLAIRASDRLSHNLYTTYKYKIPREIKHEWDDFTAGVDGVIDSVRPVFYAKYSSLPQDASLDDLVSLWKEYKEKVGILGFSDTEKQTVSDAFKEAVRRILIDDTAPSMADLQRNMELFERYREALELDRSIQDEIRAYIEKLNDFEHIDAELTTARSIDEYLNILDSFSQIYSAYSNKYDFFNYTEMKGMLQEFEPLALKEKAKVLHVLPELKDCDKKLYEKIKTIFEADGDIGNAYFVYDQNTIGDAIDILTLDTTGDVWKESLSVAIDNGMVYPGRMSSINGLTKVRLLNLEGIEMLPTGSDDISPDKVHMCAMKHRTVVLRFLNMREQLGFDRIKLQKGVVLPLDLLNRTALAYKHPSLPIMALAWFFKETLSLMEAYPEPLANGIALSPSLQRDIKTFKSLISNMEIRKGCWLIPHKEQFEKDLRAFFIKWNRNIYKTEILRTLDSVLNARLIYAGYMGKNGRRFILDAFRGSSLSYVVRNRNNELQLVPVTNHTELRCFTPLFVLR